MSKSPSLPDDPELPSSYAAARKYPDLIDAELEAQSLEGVDWTGRDAQTLAYGGLFYLVGLKTRSAEKLAALIPLFMPIAFLSTVFVPREQLPGGSTSCPA